MTNRKFKDYHKNKIAYDVINENYKLLCIVMLTLNREFPKEFYPKQLNIWLDKYAKSCKMMNEYDADGAYEYKMNQFCKKYYIDEKKCEDFIEKQCKKFNPQNRKVLSENVKLALIHTASEFGFGKLRIFRLTDAICSSEICDPIGSINKLLNYEYDFTVGQVDFRKFENKHNRSASYTECKEARQIMTALKAYQDDINAQTKKAAP